MSKEIDVNNLKEYIGMFENLHHIPLCINKILKDLKEKQTNVSLIGLENHIKEIEDLINKFSIFNTEEDRNELESKLNAAMPEFLRLVNEVIILSNKNEEAN